MPQLSDLRVKLDQMTGRITSKLKDRSRFPLNTPVYVPDAIPIAGRSGVSLFEFAIEGLERYHASLGRYNYPDQFPLLRNEERSTVYRHVPPADVSAVSISIGSDMVNFYRDFLKNLCTDHSEDPISFGETAYCDADLLELTHERINLGRYVAESKLQREPSVRDFVGDEKLLTPKLRDLGREEQVVSKAKNIAGQYELSQDVAEKYMRWIISETIKVEVEYLQKKFQPVG
ncbi:MAG: chorismate mutase [Candidatus Aenigmatarchaeota archaeon]